MAARRRRRQREQRCSASARPGPSSRMQGRHVKLHAASLGICVPWRSGACAPDAACPASPAQHHPRSPASPSLQDPILYAHTLCPYAERAWLALLEKQVPFQLVHVDLSSKPAWFRRVNPRGLVPAVQHGGEVLVESADICRWLDGAFPGPPLVPEDRQRAQEMEQLIRGPCSGAVSAGLDLCAGGRAGGGESVGKAGRHDGMWWRGNGNTMVGAGCLRECGAQSAHAPSYHACCNCLTILPAQHCACLALYF